MLGLLNYSYSTSVLVVCQARRVAFLSRLKAGSSPFTIFVYNGWAGAGKPRSLPAEVFWFARTYFVRDMGVSPAMMVGGPSTSVETCSLIHAAAAAID